MKVYVEREFMVSRDGVTVHSSQCCRKEGRKANISGGFLNSWAWTLF